MSKLYLMYSDDTVFYATESNGRSEIHANYTAKIGEWLLRFIENDTPVIEDSSIFTRESPFALLEYKFSKETLKEHYKELLDCILDNCIKTTEPILSSPIETLQLTNVFKQEYKVNHSVLKDGNGGFKISRNYIVENLPEALSVELILLLEHGVLIKKCENCNKYFFPKDNTEKYCDRPINGDKTCKDVGYIRKVENSELLKAYSTAYKTKHAQKQRSIRGKSQSTIEKYNTALDVWREDAKTELKKVQKGEVSVDEFKVFLNKKLEV